MRLYQYKMRNLGTDCDTTVTVDESGAISDYTPGCGGTMTTSFERLITDRQQQAAKLYKDIEALRAMQRKVNQRLRL